MSEDDRRQSYEDAPADGAERALYSPEPASEPPDPESIPADGHRHAPDAYVPNGDPAPENGREYEHPPHIDVDAGPTDLEVDTDWPAASELAPVPTPADEVGNSGRRRKPRLKKLRLLIVLLPLFVLALVSAVFGMIMAISSDLPALENRAEYKKAQNSILEDINGRPIGVLTGRDNRILVQSSDIPVTMKEAMIAVEDKRFYTNSGIDIKGIARAFVADIFKQRAAQGASTITQQFVKNALQAQNRRTVFEKLREAALAYHLTRKWSKDKILTEYLNSIYFGNGAYGIESAARAYFGHDPTNSQFECGAAGRPLCIPTLKAHPEEAALLAGVVASPSSYDPVLHPRAALLRRNLVLKDMYAQGYLALAQYQAALATALPARQFVIPPQEKVIDPGVAYFTTWVKQQLVDRYHVPRAFDGGLVVHTTLDYELQQKAQSAIGGYLADPSGPSAALVAIDNATGEVRAMVGGRDFNTTPFNLATSGQRQPGSAFKAFVLAQALSEGISPDSVWPSMKESFVVPGTRGREHFVVNNDEGSYAGSRSLTDATTFSDNSVFARVGILAKTPRIAALARAAGIRTHVSTNYAMTLGGLHQGVTVLDMAHAYETIAHNGQRVDGTLAATNGPVGIHSVTVPGQGHPDVNKRILRQVIPADVAATEQGLLHNVVTIGTGKAADFGVWAAGKTGTTSNYGDAWFVGFTRGDATHPGLTVAIWVGYPARLRSMSTEFNGGPVLGGTFPALIWHDFMVGAQGVFDARAAAKAAKTGQPVDTSTTPTDTTSGGGASSAGTSTTPSTRPGTTGNGGATQGGQTPTPANQPATPAPTQAAPAPSTPATPTPATPPAAAPTPNTAPANPGATGGAGASGGAQGPSGG
ncbi:MAG: transglycosylase domain-containing protein [Solirubrobacteraceae bacterium]